MVIFRILGMYGLSLFMCSDSYGSLENSHPLPLTDENVVKEMLREARLLRQRYIPQHVAAEVLSDSAPTFVFNGGIFEVLMKPPMQPQS